MGFPPRGYPPPMMGYRGERGGRGRGRAGHVQGQQRNKEYKKEQEEKQESEENPMMNAIYANDEENVQPGTEEVEVVPQGSTEKEERKAEEPEQESTDDV